MSVVNMNAEFVVSSVVESMLPCNSDDKLGLLISVKMSFSDFGYGVDGNTVERDELTVNDLVHFLFVRSSNYTKVFVFHPDKATDLPFNNSPLRSISNLWYMECDHDSCWVDSVGQELTRRYFEAGKQFKGRQKSGQELALSDVSTFVAFDNNPSYVRLIDFQKVNSQAERFSSEGRWYSIILAQIEMYQLEQIKYTGRNYRGQTQDCFSGMCIKGSEAHARYARCRENSPNRNG